MRSKQDIKNEIAQVKEQIVEVKRRMTAPTSRKYELAANAIMELDSDKGMDYLGKADKMRLEEDQLKLNNEKSTNPQTIRMKLYSSANSLNNAMSQLGPKDIKGRDRYKKMINWMYNSAASENPSLQMPANISGDSVSTPVSTPVSIPVSTGLSTGTTLSADGKSILDSTKRLSETYTDWVDFKEDDGYNKPFVRSGANIKNASKTIQSQFQTDNDEWDNNNNTAKDKANAAKDAANAAANTPEAKGNKIWKAMQKNPELKSKAQSGLSMYRSGLTSLENGSFYSAVANFIKIVMGEAVNDGDIENAFKGAGDQDTNNLLRKFFGSDFNSMSADKAGENARISAVQKIKGWKTSIDEFTKGTDEPTKEYINKAYFGGFDWDLLNKKANIVNTVKPMPMPTKTKKQLSDFDSKIEYLKYLKKSRGK